MKIESKEIDPPMVMMGSHRRDRSLQVGYLLALAGCAVATLIRWMLDLVLGDTSQFIIFYFAVAPAAMIGGLRPGLLATLLACLCGILFFAVPDRLLWPIDAPFVTRLILFALSGIMISMIAQRALSGWRVARRRLAEINAIYRTAPVGMCLLDTNLRYRAINESLAATHGRPVADHLGRSIHEILSPEIVAQVEPQILHALESGRPVLDHEISGLQADSSGAVHSFLASYTPVYGEDQRLLGVSIIVQDLTAQRHDQQKLRDSECRLRAVFDKAGVGIVEVAGNDRFVAANGRACEILGYRLEQLLQMNVHELTWPEDRELSDRQNAQVHQGQHDRVSYEKRYGCADGSPVWVHVTISAVRDDAGHWLRSITTIEDITERKRAENRLLRIVDSGIVGVLYWSMDGRINDANDKFLELVGYTRQEMEAGRINWAAMTPPEYRHLDAHASNELKTTGVDTPYEKQFVRKDGSRVWVLIGAAMLDGTREEGVAFCSDITERKEVESSLRRRTRSLQLLSDSATRLLTEDRPEQAIRRVFDTLAEHLGLEMYFNYLIREDGSGLRLNACAGVDEETCRKLQHLSFGEHVCGAVAQHGQRIVVEEMQHNVDQRTAALRSLGVQVYACHPLLAQGRVIGTLSFGSRQRDHLTPEELELLQTISNQVAMAMERTRLIDELHQRAEELDAAKTSAEHAKAAAEEASRAKDHFLAVLSHELRTPLAPVVTTAGLLEQDPDLPARYREDIATIRRNVELEARLIDDLLDVTRITRGKLQLNRQVVPLCEVIRQAVDVCEPDIDARGLHFGVDLGDSAPYFISADPSRLQQVFWNLLKNAIKFTAPGGCVGIRCRRDHATGHVVVEVNDSGKGIEPHLLPHIFHPFEQGGVHITRQFGGLGLGLTITKGLVEMHGGTIEARSAGAGQGASFVLKLPVLRAPSASDQLPPAGVALMARSQPKLRILLVEDHGDTARIMKRVLSAEGHEVQTAGDVASALDLFGRHDFDLLLSDLGLPDGSGTDVVRSIREHGRTIPAIALSGYGQEEDIRRSKDAGFNEHLIKPVDIGRLKQTIRRLGQHAQ